MKSRGMLPGMPSETQISRPTAASAHMPASVPTVHNPGKFRSPYVGQFTTLNSDIHHVAAKGTLLVVLD